MKLEKWKTIHLRLICQSPPPLEYGGETTEFGLQDKKQGIQVGQLQPDGSLVFELEAEVRLTEPVKWNGRFTHGSAPQQFLYLSWKRPNTNPPWIKRLKIPLATITGTDIEAGHTHFQATVNGSGAATVPIIEGRWVALDSVS